MNGSRRRRVALAFVVVTTFMVAVSIAVARPAPAQAQGRWLSGDLSTHTFLTNGKNAESDIVANAMPAPPFGYGLDYLANSEPGGRVRSERPGSEVPFARLALADDPLVLLPNHRAGSCRLPKRLPSRVSSGTHRLHGQVSVGIVGASNEPQGISNFEYQFDSADTDTSRVDESIPQVLDTTQPSPYPDIRAGPAHGQGEHDGPEHARWSGFLENNYPTESYAFVDHPSENLNWTIGDLRALQDAAPDVVCGFEGFPGDQAAAARGGYGNYFAADGTPVSGPSDPNYSQSETDLARTYGGADYMVAKVGGVWDALLGEGRPWYVYGDSQYSWWTTQYKDANGNVVGASFDDFWPGQYTKTWTYVHDRTYDSLVAAIKSGDSFIVNGDLINALDFHAALGKTSRTMGQTLNVKSGQKVVVTIRFKSPATNNNGDPVKVSHVDLITGDVTGMIDPSSPAYTSDDTNSSTEVAKTFGKSQMKLVGGWEVMTYTITPTSSMYFRLRGTNLADNTPNQTDANGNPLMDSLTYQTVPNPNPADSGTVTINTPDQAWADLWFYSNPIFIHVK